MHQYVKYTCVYGMLLNYALYERYLRNAVEPVAVRTKLVMMSAFDSFLFIRILKTIRCVMPPLSFANYIYFRL